MDKYILPSLFALTVTLPAQAQFAESARTNADVPRNNLFVTYNTEEHRVQDTRYAQGTSIEAGASVQIPFMRSLSLSLRPYAKERSLTLTQEDGTKSSTEFQIDTHLRFHVFEKTTWRTYVGAGVDWRHMEQRTTLEDVRYTRTEKTWGPSLSLGFDSRHLDGLAYVVMGAGEKRNTYESPYDIRVIHGKACMIPRIAMLETSGCFGMFYRAQTDKHLAEEDLEFSLELQEGFNLTDNIQLFANFSHGWGLESNTDDDKEFTTGGGMKFRWDQSFLHF